MQLELSQETVEILKNYASINNIFLFHPGKNLKTINIRGNFLSIADIKEEIPTEFGVYDLSNFVSLLSSFKNPVITFSSDKRNDGTCTFVTISGKDQKGKFKFFGSPKKIIDPENKFTHLYQKDYQFPEPKVTFDLDKEVYNSCIKAASLINGTTDSSINFIIQSQGKDGINLSVSNPKVESENSYTINLDPTQQDNSFKLIFDISHISKLLSNDYEVSLSGKALNRFMSKTSNITYLITHNIDSTFG